MAQTAAIVSITDHLATKMLDLDRHVEVLEERISRIAVRDAGSETRSVNGTEHLDVQWNPFLTAAGDLIDLWTGLKFSWRQLVQLLASVSLRSHPLNNVSDNPVRSHYMFPSTREFLNKFSFRLLYLLSAQRREIRLSLPATHYLIPQHVSVVESDMALSWKRSATFTDFTKKVFLLGTISSIKSNRPCTSTFRFFNAFLTAD